ncbi:hypothetical protein RMATCC62417_18852 [Rhizopus microsporus]|nr:hypothetical protein RMATCC62417_18852 [Rhizopus microsporus]
MSSSNNNKNINKNLDSLKTDIEDAYKLYESGDIDLFEKRIEEIKIKYTNKKTKKEDKNKELKELQNSLIQKDKKITELLDEIKKLNENNNKNNETSIKNEIEKEYTKKFNDFKNNYQYDIENDEKYKKLLEEKKKLEENKSEINKEKK